MKLKMKSIATTCFALCLSLGLFAQNTIVKGNIKNLKENFVTIGYRAGEEYKSDSVAVKNGKFMWKANINEPQQVYLALSKMYYPFFVQAGNMTITGIADSTESFVVKGSKIHDESENFEKSIKHVRDQENELYKKYGKVDKQQQADLEEKLDELRAERNGKAQQYITDHPSSFYSLHLISSRASYGTDYSDVKKLYDLLDDNAKQTKSGKTLEERLSVLKRSAIGSEMIDFTQNDTAGTAVRFASLKGKYILVDFWASWCGPCRAENPNVLSAYNKYKEKNFTVLGISLDDKDTNWKKAIRDDKMPWVQLSDLKGWKNELSTYYGIQGIPSNLLIDPSGKIIARDLRGEKLHKKLEEFLN